jgi:tetratricopeptide (TPR) repeat protein
MHNSMKAIAKITLTIILIVGLTIFYFAKFTYIKSGQDRILFLNPFQPNQTYFDKNWKIAENKLNIGDSIEAEKYYRKALSFRGTFNEKQRENIYSDANDYWEYKLDKLLKYSFAYEFIGELDSAINCLSPGLISFEKWHYPIDKRFYQLTVKKKGIENTIAILEKGLSNIQKLDCYHCCSYFYMFDNYKIGVDEKEFEQAETDRKGLLRKLCDNYGI